jgi:hypothetical protein
MKCLGRPYAESPNLGYIPLLLWFCPVRSQEEVKHYRWQYMTAVKCFIGPAVYILARPNLTFGSIDPRI